ncbi:MAG: dCMP deaminase family protein [Candidatus Enterosoma sp.]|nr:dCMP deaminase family protein [Bacilli bacterium]MDD6846982.1 dCMP deaminase family protein [bacterium]MDY2571481.1 dCMP deaminase family protein [Candidatus Enterosoma sp.]MCI6608946.1 dCMP deaminase family protein [Bacilli bacterium]MCI7065589.1 dCMP deaminase family protein [Bacilli bacterium]
MKFDNISWDEYFMSIALLSSLRSKDGNTKVGACIVSDDHKVLSLGYNGMPLGVSDEEIPWAGSKENKPYLETKYPYVCHAELNAILNSNHNLKGSTLYVTLFPCNECTKAVIQAGIKKVVYLSDKYHDTDAEVAARRMLDMAKIPYVHYEGRLPDIKFHE